MQFSPIKTTAQSMDAVGDSNAWITVGSSVYCEIHLFRSMCRSGMIVCYLVNLVGN